MEVLPDDLFYAEWVPFDKEVSERDAMSYLVLWRRFLLEKLEFTNPELECINTAYIERPKIDEKYLDPLNPIKLITDFKSTLGIKIHMREKDQ